MHHSLFFGVYSPFHLSLMEPPILMQLGRSWRHAVHQHWVYFLRDPPVRIIHRIKCSPIPLPMQLFSLILAYKRPTLLQPTHKSLLEFRPNPLPFSALLSCPLLPLLLLIRSGFSNGMQVTDVLTSSLSFALSCRSYMHPGIQPQLFHIFTNSWILCSAIESQLLPARIFFIRCIAC